MQTDATSAPGSLRKLHKARVHAANMFDARDV